MVGDDEKLQAQQRRPRSALVKASEPATVLMGRWGLAAENAGAADRRTGREDQTKRSTGSGREGKSKG